MSSRIQAPRLFLVVLAALEMCIMDTSEKSFSHANAWWKSGTFSLTNTNISCLILSTVLNSFHSASSHACSEQDNGFIQAGVRTLPSKVEEPRRKQNHASNESVQRVRKKQRTLQIPHPVGIAVSVSFLVSSLVLRLLFHLCLPVTGHYVLFAANCSQFTVRLLVLCPCVVCIS